MDIRKKYEKQTGKKPYCTWGATPEYVEWLEAGQVDAVVIGLPLLRELAVRTNVRFPKTPEELRWFEEGTENSGSFQKRLNDYFEQHCRITLSYPPGLSATKPNKPSRSG